MERKSLSPSAVSDGIIDRLVTEGSDLSNPTSEETRSDASPAESAFPTEPFLCPACGQMLGPTVRVCVACKQPIDPAQIKKPTATAAPLQTQPSPPVMARVGFPWPLFFGLLLVRVLAALAAERRWGLFKAELVLGGVEVLSAAWVYFDARTRQVPKPLRWGLGSLFLWILVFPWYIARRRMPQASCPFVEAEAGPVARAVLFVLVVFFLLGAVIVILKGPPG